MAVVVYTWTIQQNRRCNTNLSTLHRKSIFPLALSFMANILVIKLLSVRESLCVFFTFGTVMAGKQLVQRYGCLPCFCVYRRILEGISMVITIMETMIKLLAISSLWLQICQHMVNDLPLTVNVTLHTYVALHTVHVLYYIPHTHLAATSHTGMKPAAWNHSAEDLATFLH